MTEQERYENMVDEIIDLKNEIKDLQAEIKEWKRVVETWQELHEKDKAEKEDLFYKLTGVMHSVDKWLDGDELKQDEVNRAATMREKTLQIVESLQAENERLSQFGGILLRNGSELFKEIQTAKAEAYKECIEKAKEKAHRCDLSTDENEYYSVSVFDLDNLLKELVGEDNV
jgi:hypothetical protein